MRWHLECKHRGQGKTVECSFSDAARLAKEECTTDSSCWVIWALPSNIRMAETTLRGLRWIKTSISAEEVKTLMRRHKWTISSLSFRLGVTQDRIRQAMGRGLHDANTVRDWIEAMTGADVGPLPDRYYIKHWTEECGCAQCGYPMDVGDCAFEYLSESFCSVTCCRQSRGWGKEVVA